mmetsp:Transcript_79753/g.258349  ORF Transcript_79753/g.258349 Transcript_79753/m.258349 type:complete len:141 (-) Transcript_79753:763-1185(-)
MHPICGNTTIWLLALATTQQQQKTAAGVKLPNQLQDRWAPFHSIDKTGSYEKTDWHCRGQHEHNNHDDQQPRRCLYMESKCYGMVDHTPPAAFAAAARSCLRQADKMNTHWPSRGWRSTTAKHVMWKNGPQMRRRSGVAG